MRNSIAIISSVVAIGLASLIEADGLREEIQRRSLSMALEQVKVGDTLSVKDTSGTTWIGRFDSLDVANAALVLRGARPEGTPDRGDEGHRLELMEPSIELVVHVKTRSGARGALIGAGIGVGGAALAAQGCCGNPDYGPEYMFAILGPVLGGIGAVLGYVAGKGSTKREVIYTTEPASATLRWRIAPMVSRERKGAVFSLSF